MRKPSEFADHPMSHIEAVQRGVLRAFCKHVTDGDTYDMFISLGLDQYAYTTIRLHAFDTPEIFHPSNDAELEHGRAARDFVASHMLDRPCILTTFRDQETFGRYVADVGYLAGDGFFSNLASILRKKGFAKSPTY